MVWTFHWFQFFHVVKWDEYLLDKKKKKELDSCNILWLYRLVWVCKAGTSGRVTPTNCVSSFFSIHRGSSGGTPAQQKTRRDGSVLHQKHSSWSGRPSWLTGGPQQASTEKDDEDEIVGHAFVFLLAGYETSSNMLAFTCCFLVIHPECQCKDKEGVDGFFTRHLLISFSLDSSDDKRNSVHTDFLFFSFLFLKLLLNYAELVLCFPFCCSSHEITQTSTSWRHGHMWNTAPLSSWTWAVLYI